MLVSSLLPGTGAQFLPPPISLQMVLAHLAPRPNPCSHPRVCSASGTPPPRLPHPGPASCAALLQISGTAECAGVEGLRQGSMAGESELLVSPVNKRLARLSACEARDGHAPHSPLHQPIPSSFPPNSFHPPIGRSVPPRRLRRSAAAVWRRTGRSSACRPPSFPAPARAWTAARPHA